MGRRLLPSVFASVKVDAARSRAGLLVPVAAVLVLSPVFFFSGPASARPIRAGLDYFETQPGTYQDFSAAPIPPDFFDPGSDPFLGRIDFLGVPTVAGSTAHPVVRGQEAGPPECSTPPAR